MKLREIAHCRTGDKGTLNTLSVFARRPEHFAALSSFLTTDYVKHRMQRFVQGQVERWELPNLSALQFTLHDMVRGDVTTALELDVHGKTLGGILLDTAIPQPVVDRFDLESIRVISGARLSDDDIHTPGPLTVVLAGAGLDPRMFGSTLSTTSADDTRIRYLDYLVGDGPFTIRGIAHGMAAQLESREGETYLIGHSLGGAVAIAVAAMAGQRVTRLVVSDTGVRADNHGDPHLVETLTHTWDDATQADFLKSCTASPLDPAETRRQLGHLAATRASAMAQSVASLRDTDLRESAHAVIAPTTVVHGIRDPRRTIDHAREIRDHIPDASLFLLDCGHTPLAEVPRESAAIIDSALS